MVRVGAEAPGAFRASVGVAAGAPALAPKSRAVYGAGAARAGGDGILARVTWRARHPSRTRHSQPPTPLETMGLINWIFDIYQQTRIEGLKDDLAQSRNDALRFQSPAGGLDTQRLASAIGELALAVKTVQRLAVQKGLCTTDEFQRVMRQIDAEDGIADGRSPVR